MLQDHAEAAGDSARILAKWHEKAGQWARYFDHLDRNRYDTASTSAVGRIIARLKQPVMGSTTPALPKASEATAPAAPSESTDVQQSFTMLAIAGGQLSFSALVLAVLALAIAGMAEAMADPDGKRRDASDVSGADRPVIGSEKAYPTYP